MCQIFAMKLAIGSCAFDKGLEGARMNFRIVFAVGVLGMFAAGHALAGPVTGAPDPGHGGELAARLCSNCHLVGASQQEHANVDIPSFQEIANKEG